MKWSFRVFVAWLALVCMPSASNLSAAENSSGSATVVLNGLTTLFGEPEVFLQVISPGLAAENISLTVGQSAAGIQLLAVDVKAASMQINNHGQIQTIKISNPPSFTPALPEGQAVAAAAANDDAAGTNGSVIRHSPDEPVSYSATRPGNLEVAPIAGTALTADQPSANDASNTSSGNGKSPTHIYYWWMEDAQKIEQARVENAAKVLAGEMPAEPLTPLTPAGTPANLIGDFSVYLEHGRGQVVNN